MNNNKLIAEFMGLPYEEQELSYNVSWDWLMPVIENIDHLEYGKIQSIENALSTRCIDDTYEAVVQFIKNYKNN